jgi:hypothetical protein
MNANGVGHLCSRWTAATIGRQGAIACLPCVRAALGGTLVFVLEWSDLRVFLAVSTSSRFTAAAKARNLWVVVHAELATQTRVRAVVDFVTRQFAASRDAFAGKVRRPR